MFTSSRRGAWPLLSLHNLPEVGISARPILSYLSLPLSSCVFSYLSLPFLPFWSFCLAYLPRRPPVREVPLLMIFPHRVSPSPSAYLPYYACFLILYPSWPYITSDLSCHCDSFSVSSVLFHNQYSFSCHLFFCLSCPFLSLAFLLFHHHPLCLLPISSFVLNHFGTMA